jgi:hypothetical protein
MTATSPTIRATHLVTTAAAAVPARTGGLPVLDGYLGDLQRGPAGLLGGALRR